ncbi:hypothetical protein B7R22_16635 [Subtercola boreus]|uniref:DUF7674 domain-containing protein n=1 Tax=Subtercola boreus TaxID=120213 RepID=A0A3E0VQI5_9MICO|nr:hypothetical protein [Subtercola boreus]RFA12254.1 hypothetical protein B7R22_16635 [Subtercola boreus]
MAGPRTTKANFVDQLVEAVPESESTVVEHLDYFDELLLHLLMADLLRFATASFANGRTDISDRLLRFVDASLTGGDEYIQNAVKVSFVEHFSAWPGETPEFLDTWPLALRSALEAFR